MKKLFLLDALALIYRSHFAFIRNPRYTSTGMNTSATYGFMRTLLDVLRKEKPTHIGVAFDTATPTFRHVQYAEYKAHRQQQPEDITLAIPYIKKILEAMNIPILIKPGFEADDIIGTLAKRASQADFTVYMMTPDKDYGQLVEENIYMYKPALGGKEREIWGVKEVLENWGIAEISQVTDILGLQGDSSDNIPGIPGIGEKTAQKLIAEYNSVENLIANADKLAGKIKDNVIKFADQGILSKQLAVIDINVPVDFEEENLILSEYNKNDLGDLLDELEFRTIKAEIFGEKLQPKPKVTQQGQMDLFASPQQPAKVLDAETQAIVDKQIQEINEIFGVSTAIIPTENQSVEMVSTIPVPEKNTIETTLHQYHLIDSESLIRLLVEHLEKQQRFCFDTETDNIDPVEAKVIGMSFCVFEREAYYVPVPEDAS
ncbi:MAG: DNA polymerase I, partial [Verrucomicrobia bacterium]|nr:DNA polymerase I [Cytophagales bacterium]